MEGWNSLSLLFSFSFFPFPFNDHLRRIKISSSSSSSMLTVNLLPFFLFGESKDNGGGIGRGGWKFYFTSFFANEE